MTGMRSSMMATTVLSGPPGQKEIGVDVEQELQTISGVRETRCAEVTLKSDWREAFRTRRPHLTLDADVLAVVFGSHFSFTLWPPGPQSIRQRQTGFTPSVAPSCTLKQLGCAKCFYILTFEVT